MIHDFPTWITAFLVSGGFVGLTVAALALVNRLWPVLARHEHNDIAGFLIAVVGVLYAVLLASIAILALEIFSRAEEVVLREAELLGDMYRSAAFLPAETASGLRTDLKTYAATVIEEEWPQMRRGVRPDTAWPALERMQAKLFAIAPQSKVQEIAIARFMEDLDQLYDARRDRLFLAFRGIEPVVWWVVLSGAAATLAFSLFFGVANVKAHMAMTGLLAFSLSLVIVLITAIDQPLRGDTQISSEPFQYVADQFERLDRGLAQR
jgi:hypothetical protein